MKLINSTLYIEFAELVACGVSELTLKSAKAKGVKSWEFINDPDDSRRVLIGFEKMTDKYKDMVKARFGNPYEAMARQPIRSLVSYDQKAEAFYLSYRFDGNKMLPIEHVKKYATAASWLNMLNEQTADKKALKKLLNLTIDQFYVNVLELIKIENVDLPTSYRRLIAKCKEYQEQKYEALIDWRFGNKLAAKINDEISEAILLEMIAHSNQFDDVFIAHQYNAWASQNGYKTIDPSTVGVHRRSKEHLIIMQREGNVAFTNKYTPQIKGMRPSFPLALIEGDDNHIDLQFIEVRDDDSKNYHARYIAAVVIDSYNDYVLGYAYTTGAVTTEVIKAAYVNALYYIRYQTGGWYLPHETKADRWGGDALTPFYKELGMFIPSAVGNKNRGYIEQFFRTPTWKRAMKLGANNYTGNNLTALTRGVNVETVRANIKNRPLIGDESFNQVEQFFHRLRHMPQTKGKQILPSKHEQWLEAWNNLPEEKKRPITDEQFLFKFGVPHLFKKGNQVTISNRGIEPTIQGIDYSYNLAEYDLNHIGKKVHLLYDPYDMSRVLLTDFENIRVMAYEAQLRSKAIADSHLNSGTYLKALIEEKTDVVDKVTAKANRRKQILEQNYVYAESVLVSGVITKEIKQESETILLTQHTTPKQTGTDSLWSQL